MSQVSSQQIQAWIEQGQHSQAKQVLDSLSKDELPLQALLSVAVLYARLAEQAAVRECLVSAQVKANNDQDRGLVERARQKIRAILPSFVDPLAQSAKLPGFPSGVRSGARFPVADYKFTAEVLGDGYSVRDVSLTGLFLVDAGRLPVGQVLPCQLAWVQADQQRQLLVKVMVVRAVEDGAGVVLQFTNMDDQTIWIEFIEGLSRQVETTMKARQVVPLSRPLPAYYQDKDVQYAVRIVALCEDEAVIDRVENFGQTSVQFVLKLPNSTSPIPVIALVEDADEKHQRLVFQELSRIHRRLLQSYLASLAIDVSDDVEDPSAGHRLGTGVSDNSKLMQEEIVLSSLTQFKDKMLKEIQSQVVSFKPDRLRTVGQVVSLKVTVTDALLPVASGRMSFLLKGRISRLTADGHVVLLIDDSCQSIIDRMRRALMVDANQREGSVWLSWRSWFVPTLGPLIVFVVIIGSAYWMWKSPMLGRLPVDKAALANADVDYVFYFAPDFAEPDDVWRLDMSGTQREVLAQNVSFVRLHRKSGGVDLFLHNQDVLRVTLSQIQRMPKAMQVNLFASHH